MPMLENELARRQTNGNGLELRPQPVRVQWVWDDLITADSNDLKCTFTCSVRALSDATERRMLEEVLLGPRTALRAEHVMTHFSPTLRAAAADQARSKGVAAWLEAGAKEQLVAALKKAATQVAFSCGLEVLPPFQLDVESRSYAQEQARQMQRRLAEQQAAGQVEHFTRAAELLKKFQDIRQSAPELSAGRVLEQMSPADRGSMLQTLLLAAGKQEEAADLWAVAGPYLVRIDVRNGPARTALTPLPPTLGPLRSIQPAQVEGQRVLLVGARSGFMIVRAGSAEEATLYPDAAVESQLGFSRVVYLGRTGAFLACHGEAGIVRWNAGHTAGPVATIRPERFSHGTSRTLSAAPPPISTSGSDTASLVTSPTPGPRNLQVLDEERIIFSVGSRLWVLHGNEPAELPAEDDSEVIAILPDVPPGTSQEARHMLVVHENGTVCTFDTGTRQVIRKDRRGLRLRAAGVLPWMGGARLLLAPEDGPVQCVGTDDPLVTQYASGHRGLRVVTGSADLVAGVSADRQRLIIWNTWEGRQPLTEVYLTGITKHRVADVEFG